MLTIKCNIHTRSAALSLQKPTIVAAIASGTHLASFADLCALPTIVGVGLGVRASASTRGLSNAAAQASTQAQKARLSLATLDPTKAAVLTVKRRHGASTIALDGPFWAV